MEQLLKKRSVCLTGCALDKQEECPITGEYTLPEYCPDIAVILKSFAYPHIQNRQWSGEQLLLDGSAVIRVWYLDEDRRCLRSLEFTQPFSCTMRGEGKVDNGAVNIELSTKYLNCRALSPRRIEVRGAIAIGAYADRDVCVDLGVDTDDEALYTRAQTFEITTLGGMCDKILTVSDSVEIPDHLPPVEMLLGGECCAVIQECKLLVGKAIVKGQVFLHQLYLSAVGGEGTHSLDYAIPFSQILDIDGAVEGQPFRAFVQILSDTERCNVGPSGANTSLDISVKLLVQVQAYVREEISVLQDAYHGRFPITKQTERVGLCAVLGSRFEETVLPMKVAVETGRWQAIVDVSVQSLEHVVEQKDGRLEIKGRLLVCVVACDMDREIVYDEFVEEYVLEYPSIGNNADIRLTPTALKYRMIENCIEMQVTLCVTITDIHCKSIEAISGLRLQQDAPYPQQKVTAMLYYADAGETAWDIGCCCHTSPSCICEENGLMDECVPEPMVLVVPVIN